MKSSHRHTVVQNHLRICIFDLVPVKLFRMQLQIFLAHVVWASRLNSSLPRGHKISFDKVATLMSCFSDNGVRILHCCKKVQQDKLPPYISIKRNVQIETMTLLFKLVIQTEYVRTKFAEGTHLYCEFQSSLFYYKWVPFVNFIVHVLHRV